jgi:hypothetical protein
MWATTEVRPRGKESPLNEDTSTSKQWLDNIPDVNNLYDLSNMKSLKESSILG